MKLFDQIAHLEPCEEAVKWLDQYDDAQVAWDNCKCGEWMLSYLGHLSGAPKSATRRKLVACAADCAALALSFLESHCSSDNPVRNCIDTCRRWAAKKASIEELRKAAAAAYHAAFIADIPAYTRVSNAAVFAASISEDSASTTVADSAASVGVYVIYAAHSYVVYEANAANKIDARDYSAKVADVVRQHYPMVPR